MSDYRVRADKVPDFLEDRQASRFLAQRIQRYWASRGYRNVQVRAVRCDETGKWIVRSNLKLRYRDE